MKLVQTLFGYTALLALSFFLAGCGGSSGSSESSDATLSGLTLDGITLDQIFQSGSTSYTADVGFLTSKVSFTAAVTDSAATVTINGTAVTGGTESNSISLAEGANLFTIVVTAEDGTTNTYTIEITRETAEQVAQQARLKASVTGGNDNFGYSVAIDGDTLVLGAQREDSDSINDPTSNEQAISGAAYVFARTGGTWTQQAYLKADAPEGNAQFGRSVGIYEDTIVIGEPLRDGTGTDKGAVYIFTRTDTTWTQQVKLSASDAVDYDNFGESVALENGTLVVGAIGVDSGTGAAYVFTGSGANWTEQFTLQAADKSTGDEFGNSVAISGDTILAGSLKAAIDGVDDAGAAYIFTGSGSSWNQQQKLVASLARAEFDNFGFSVALDGDVAVIGAPFRTDTDNGQAFTFTRTENTWGAGAPLPVIASSGDNFGQSVAIDGNVIAVSARYSQSASGTNNAGEVELFSFDGSNWNYEDRINADNDGALDEFGFSIALDNGTLVVGAKFEDSNADGTSETGSENSGAAYIFE